MYDWIQLSTRGPALLDSTHHLSITVADLERSIGWYTELLGLELLSRQRNDSAYSGAIVGMDGAILEVAFLTLPGSDRIRLELIQYLQPRGEPAQLTTNTPGVAHVAFEVADVDAALARLAAAGSHPLNPPVEIDRGANRGMRACYLRDPDGFTIELMEPPALRRDAAAARRSAGRRR